MKSWNQSIIRFWNSLSISFPLRRNFFLFLGIALLLKQLSKEINEVTQGDTVYFKKSLINFLWQIFTEVWAVMMLIAFISLIFTYIRNVRRLKKEGSYTLYSSYDKYNLDTILSLQLPTVRPSLLGYLFVVYRMNKWYTDNAQVTIHADGIREADYTMNMPFVKRYEFQKFILIQEDLFKFFRFNIFHDLNKEYTQRAAIVNIDYVRVSPAIADEEERRSDKINTIAGEWLNNKKFESSDDFRRIIWRVYAQSRELMVRTQEFYSPYSSNLRMYISFLCRENNLLPSAYISDWFSTKFKNASWTIFQNLSQKENFEVKLNTGQKIGNLDVESKEEYEHELISVSDWASSPTLTEQIKEKGPYLLLISVFIGVDDLRDLLDLQSRGFIYLIAPDPMQKSSKKRNLKDLIYRNPSRKTTDIFQLYKWSGGLKAYNDQKNELISLLDEYGADYVVITD